MKQKVLAVTFVVLSSVIVALWIYIYWSTSSNVLPSDLPILIGFAVFFFASWGAGCKLIYDAVMWVLR